MIPHTSETPLRTRKARLLPPSPRRAGSAELSCHESADGTTGSFSFSKRFRLGEDADHRLRAGWPHQHAAAAVELLVEPLYLAHDALRELPPHDANVVLDLWKTLHLRRRLLQGPPFERPTEEKPCGKAVAGHVVAQVDDVARLLPAQQPALAVERLEDVAVADVGRDHADAVLFGEPVQAEIRHHGDGHELDLEVEHQDREDLVAVDDLAARVDREHPVAVAVERDPEVGPGARNSLLQGSEVRGAVADVDVRAVGVRPNGGDLGAELLERRWGDAGVRAVRAVDDHLQAAEIGTDALDDVFEVAVRGNADVVDRPGLSRKGRVEQRLDFLLGLVGELAALAVEELDAVVLGRVVRGGDDGAEVKREQRDGRGRQHAGQNGVPSRRDDPARKGLLELGPRGARVAPDEDAPALRPEGRGPAEPLDELGSQVLADDSSDPVGPEVPTWH